MLLLGCEDAVELRGMLLLLWSCEGRCRDVRGDVNVDVELVCGIDVVHLFSRGRSKVYAGAHMFLVRAECILGSCACVWFRDR
eukprot:3932878-Rhodomonas_salina.1